jgi:hypothetical protein
MSGFWPPLSPLKETLGDFRAERCWRAIEPITECHFLLYPILSNCRRSARLTHKLHVMYYSREQTNGNQNYVNLSWQSVLLRCALAAKPTQVKMSSRLRQNSSLALGLSGLIQGGTRYGPFVPFTISTGCFTDKASH